MKSEFLLLARESGNDESTQKEMKFPETERFFVLTTYFILNKADGIKAKRRRKKCAAGKVPCNAKENVF